MYWVVLLSMVKSVLGVGSVPSEGFADVRIERLFAACLTESPLLMELGGAEVIEVQSDRRIVVGVGKAVLGDGSAADAERATRVATLKARAAIVAELAGVRVSQEKRETVTDVRKSGTGSEESMRVLITRRVVEERAAGWLKGVRPIGTWRSKDGLVLYVAVGGSVPPTE